MGETRSRREERGRKERGALKGVAHPGVRSAFFGLNICRIGDPHSPKGGDEGDRRPSVIRLNRGIDLMLHRPYRRVCGSVTRSESSEAGGVGERFTRATLPPQEASRLYT